MVLCAGGEIIPLETAQDYKRIFDNDEGPNTGGMGAYTPLPWAPPELVPQILGTPPGATPGATIVSWAKPTSQAGLTAAVAIHDQLVALRSFKIIPIDGVDRAPPTHRAEIVIDELAIAEPRRALCKWYDGRLVGTFSIVDLSNGRVVWSKQVTSTISKRVHFSSRSDVIDEMVDEAIAGWMTAFRSAGVLKPKR